MRTRHPTAPATTPPVKPLNFCIAVWYSFCILTGSLPPSVSECARDLITQYFLLGLTYHQLPTFTTFPTECLRPVHYRVSIVISGPPLLRFFPWAGSRFFTSTSPPGSLTPHSLLLLLSPLPPHKRDITFPVAIPCLGLTSTPTTLTRIPNYNYFPADCIDHERRPGISRVDIPENLRGPRRYFESGFEGICRWSSASP